MPLYKSITANNHTKVLIWKIEESEEVLRQHIELTTLCENRIATMKSEIHRRGFLSVRQLLKVAGYKPSDLYYDDEGRPHLKDGKKISITHSFIFSAIVISEKIVGIDIEKQREKIKIIAKKFVGEEHKFVTTSNQVELLTFIWCIKESLYKAFAKSGISFKQHIKVLPFNYGDKSGKASVIYEKEIKVYDVYFLAFDGFGFAYAIEEDE